MAPWQVGEHDKTRTGGAATAYSPGLGSGVQELLAEVLPVLIRRGLLDNNLPVVIRQLEDDVPVLLALLEIVVCGYAFLRNGGSRGVDLLVILLEFANSRLECDQGGACMTDHTVACGEACSSDDGAAERGNEP